MNPPAKTVLLGLIVLVASFAWVGFAHAQDPVVYNNPGVSVSLNIAKGQWSYYTVAPSLFEQTSTDYHVSFMLTSLSGDGNLYVSNNGKPNGPPCTNCIVASESPFSEVQTVDRNDTTKWPTGNNVFTVGIYGNSDCEVVFNVWPSYGKLIKFLVD